MMKRRLKLKYPQQSQKPGLSGLSTFFFSSSSFSFFISFCCCCCCCFVFRAAPTEYGSFQARGQIRATAAGLNHSHSNGRSKPPPQPTHRLWQCWISDPLNKARYQTRIFKDTSPHGFISAVLSPSFLPSFLSFSLFLSLFLSFSFFLSLFLSFVFLGLHPKHIEVLRLGVKSKL